MKSVILTKKTVGGCTIEINPSNVILSITNDVGNKVKLNDEVISAGTFAPEGMVGLVIDIAEPYSNNDCSDVILCEFENGFLSKVKFKDLVF